VDSLPASVRVVRFQGQLASGRTVSAWCARVRLRDRRLEVKCVAAQQGKGLTRTSALAREHQALVAINGGYFTFRADTAQGGRTSVSLLASGGQLLAPDLPVNRKLANGQTARCYPTRGALGLRRRRADVAWAAAYSGQWREYPAPHPFSDTVGQPKPAPGRPWPMQEVMGGGPVLVQNGRKRITDRDELFGQIAGPHPRTAVGYTARRELLLLVVDGRQAHSQGVTFDELAELMLSLGAAEAVNLDGGGSSALVVRGRVVNSPSDKTGERPVASALVVRLRP
jgi:hypothetical protein